MGLLNSLQGDRIYLDVNIWIYALGRSIAFSWKPAIREKKEERK
jgi:hypothetical protein